MAAKSKVTGRKVVWRGDRWVYLDTGEKATNIRPCLKCGHEPIGVRVKIPTDLSHIGIEYWKIAKIDYCIAPIVKALQDAGIDMRGSCCGHGEAKGTILLQDRRVLVIKKD